MNKNTLDLDCKHNRKGLFASFRQKAEMDSWLINPDGVWDELIDVCTTEGMRLLFFTGLQLLQSSHVSLDIVYVNLRNVTVI